MRPSLPGPGRRGRRWRDRSTIIGLAAGLVALLFVLVVLPSTSRPADAGSVVVERRATMETGNLSEFDSINSSADLGTLAVAVCRTYEGSYSAHAAVPTGLGNKFARGIFDVAWTAGTDSWYGAAFYLPGSFYDRQQSEVDILRWDNWSLAERSQDQSGVSIGADGRLTMVFKDLEAGEYTELIEGGAPRLTPDRWHFVEARQKLGGDGDAINELWVDGELAGRSTIHNYLGRPATALRVGIVAIDAESQTSSLDLWFDSASVSGAPHQAMIMPFPRRAGCHRPL